MEKAEPVFDFHSENRSVLLKRGKVEMCVDGKSYRTDGEAYLDFTPSARLNFYATFQEEAFWDVMSLTFKEKNVDYFSFNNRKIEGFLVNVQGDTKTQGCKIKWSPAGEPVTGLGSKTTKMNLVKFHLFNFVDFWGTSGLSEQQGNENRKIHQVKLQCAKWDVQLNSLFYTKENIELLKNEGGYQLTHVGRIKRIDGNDFNAVEAEDILSALNYFFSFAVGRWCRPTCPVGLDRCGNPVWELWSPPKEPWRNCMSWFDSHHSSQLVDFFPRFMKLWSYDNWHETLQEVFYWYLNANDSSRGVDVGIILAQTAIERLSFEYSVKTKKYLSVGGFKELRASDRFRLLFSSVEIPLSFPSETSDFAKLRKQMNWEDIPRGLTEIRNSLVHPDQKNRAKFKGVYFDAWNLGMWCLELAILAVCYYSGTYGNRLNISRWIGQVEEVPWRKTR
jgi:hypothetical protein